MKKRINVQFMIITAIAIIGTICLLTIGFYEIFKIEVFEELKTTGYFLGSTNLFSDPERIDFVSQNDKIRVTLIDENGKILFDNKADISSMDNHINRREIQDAMNKGEASIIRKSNTRNSNTFYYAKRLDNGCILRVGKESRNIKSIIDIVIPAIMVFVLILIVIIVVITRLLTKRLVAPIEQMANDVANYQGTSSYKEIQPFIDMIQKQHENIIHNSKLRQEFTANVTHELKTPLTVISGYSELIENGMAGQEDVQRFAKEIHRNSNRLLSLINDILQLSEMDVATNTSSMEQIDLYEIATNVVNMLELKAEKHKMMLHLSGEKSMVFGNRMMLEELIYNLTDNGIRYNNVGGNVWVNVNHKDNHTILTVKDDGIGISTEHQNRIFERFYRVDKSRSKLTGGTGLGLAIVKHIVEHHEASLHMTSEVGEGTTIQIEFGK